MTSLRRPRTAFMTKSVTLANSKPLFISNMAVWIFKILIGFHSIHRLIPQHLTNPYLFYPPSILHIQVGIAKSTGRILCPLELKVPSRFLTALHPFLNSSCSMNIKTTTISEVQPPPLSTDKESVADSQPNLDVNSTVSEVSTMPALNYLALSPRSQCIVAHRPIADDATTDQQCAAAFISKYFRKISNATAFHIEPQSNRRLVTLSSTYPIPILSYRGSRLHRSTTQQILLAERDLREIRLHMLYSQVTAIACPLLFLVTCVPVATERS